MKKGICVVSDYQCKAPAGWGGASGYATNNMLRVSSTCSHCGEFVCTSCSSGRGKARLCDNCHRDLAAAVARMTPEAKQEAREFLDAAATLARS